MKNINISNIILAAEKAEKEKADLKWQIDQGIKKAGRCETDEGRAKWQEIVADLKNELATFNTSFYDPLDEALAAFEKPYRVRTFDTAKNLLAFFQKFLDVTDIPKKYFDGTVIYLRAYAGTFPAAYNGTPTTTEATFSNKNGKWYLTSLDRVTVKKDRVTCAFSTATQMAIIKKYTSLYF